MLDSTRTTSFAENDGNFFLLGTLMKRVLVRTVPARAFQQRAARARCAPVHMPARMLARMPAHMSKHTARGGRVERRWTQPRAFFFVKKVNVAGMNVVSVVMTNMLR